MSDSLKHITLTDFELRCGKKQTINVSYQIFGRALHTAPIILVNHALTGNSSVTGWWSRIVGSGKAIDTDGYTVISMDIPGNGFDAEVEHLIYNYQDWTLEDVGHAFAKALQLLKVCYIHAGIGGSIGGCLLWEMVVAYPELFETIIPIASDWKATDWLIANCHVQHRILSNSKKPVEDARQHAMTFYRTSQSLRHKFNGETDDDFKVKGWLNHHGKNLKGRFTLPAYHLMNHLLMSTNAGRNHNDNIAKALQNSDTKIRLIAINSDGFFIAQEDRETYELLKNHHDITYQEIDSIHGHDAFLIEHDQVTTLLEKELKNSITHRAVAPCL